MYQHVSQRHNPKTIMSIETSLLIASDITTYSKFDGRLDSIYEYKIEVGKESLVELFKEKIKEYDQEKVH